MLRDTGFTHLKVGGDTDFNSSPKTKGTLIGGRKPLASECCRPEEPEGNTNIRSEYEENRRFEAETILEEAYQSGCKEAKIIDPKTIAVGNWVRWKCMYGCPLYEKDGCHPPYAPGVEETREMLREYSKALLIKGMDGSKLSQITLNLERSAYNLGYYKAFALISLPVTPGNT